MPFLIISQPQQKLKEYLNRRIQKSTQNEQGEGNDFFRGSRNNSFRKLKKSKRFNTTMGQRCDMDFRIQTFYQPTVEYKFTGEHLKNKYGQTNPSFEVDSKQIQSGNYKPPPKCLTQGVEFQLFKRSNNQHKQTEEIYNVFLNQEFNLTNSFIVTSPNNNKFKTRSNTLNSHSKFRISHPAPVKQAEFLVKLKKDFIKRHGLNNKQKKSTQKNDLIKIQDFISERKQSFKRHMQTQLIRTGQAKLLTQIQERKGKIYLSGLHNTGKKKKVTENIDQLLRKSRGSFSTPNTLIAHLKLGSEKKSKLQNIRKLKQKTLDKCLQKIKSMNIKSQMIFNSKGR